MLTRLLPWPRRRRPAAPPRSPRRATPAVECLEARAVPAVTISPTGPNLAAATVGALYARAFSAAPSGTYTFSETGALPAGLTLSTGGTLSGKPTAAGTFRFTVTATPTGGTGTTSPQYTLVVHLGVTPTTLTAALAGVAYSQTITPA